MCLLPHWIPYLKNTFVNMCVNVYFYCISFGGGNLFSEWWGGMKQQFYLYLLFSITLTQSNPYALCLKKCPHFYSLNYSVKITDFNDFWYVKSWENFTSKLRDLPNSRASCRQFNQSKKSFFNNIIHAFFWVTEKIKRWTFSWDMV